MKLWKVIPALLFLTPTLHAQNPFYSCPNPFYTCPPYTQPYYPSAYYVPSYGVPPYYVSTYGVPPYYTPSAYASNTVLTFNTDEAVNGLTRQVQELSQQVRELSVEVALAKAQQPQPGPRPSEAIGAPERPPTPVITFILKDGRHVASQGYAIAGPTLWILTLSGYERTALSNVDLVATQRENRRRGITFDLPQS
jgi:hypothetical protein